MSKLLIHAYGASNALADIAEPRHKAACAQHGLEYVRVNAPESLYGRFSILSDLLKTAYENEIIVYLDSDAVWTDTSVSLSSALDAGYDVGLTKTRSGLFHAGAIYLRNTQATRDYITRVAAVPVDLTNPWFGSQTLTDQALTGIKVQTLTRNWNEWVRAVGPIEPSIVTAFHGYPTKYRVAKMTALVSK